MSDTRLVSIVGAHGQIARLLARDLTSRSMPVRGLVRDEGQFSDLRDDGTEPVLCDLESASDDELDAALAGSNTVVFAAGSGPGSGPERKKTLDRDGAIATVESAARVGAEHFVIVSSMGADNPPQDDETFSVYLRAKHDADVAVRRATSLPLIDHTIVRPGKLTDDDPTGSVQIAETVDRGEVPRADVAAVIAQIVATGAAKGTTIELVSGEDSIAGAVAAL